MSLTYYSQGQLPLLVSLLLHVELGTPPACVKCLLAPEITHPPTTPTTLSPWWMGLTGQGRDWADPSCPQISGQRQLEVKALRRALHFFFKSLAAPIWMTKVMRGRVLMCVYMCVCKQHPLDNPPRPSAENCPGGKVIELCWGDQG